MSPEALSRRSVLRGVAVTAVGGIAGYVVARTTNARRAPGVTTAANGYGGAPKGGRALTPLDRVPVAGGVVLAGDNVVLTRDASGTVHGFSAVCTHQGCTVDSVADGAIGCPCHGSRFNADTGAVLAGPATRPLPAVAVVVRDGSVYAS